MRPLEATGYTCPSCGRAYRVNLGYLVPVEDKGA
jgi:hypothetical protein